MPLSRIFRTLRKYAEGIIATALGLVAMTIFAKSIWDAWDNFIRWLILQGAPAGTDLFLGFLMFAAAIYLGVIQLKKFKC